MPTRSISFKEFSNFAVRHAPVFEGLFDRADEDLSHSDLSRIIEAVWQDGWPAPETVVRNLIEMRIVEAIDHTESAFRYTPIIADLQRHLALSPDPVSARSILANVSDLADAASNLRKASESHDGTLALRALEDLRRLCKNILRGVGENFRFVTNEVLDLKKSAATMPIRDRFTRLDYAWSRYAEPLRAMLLGDGEFRQRIDSAEHFLKRAIEAGLFVNREEAEALRRYLAVVLNATNRAIIDCVKTVQPLLERLRADSLVSAGAAVGMGQFIKHGGIASGLTKFLPVALSSERDCFADEDLAHTFRTLLTIRPSPPPSIPETVGDRTSGADIAFMTDAIDSLAEAGDVPDVLTHLLVNFPGRSSYDCLYVFHHLTKPASGFKPSFGPPAEFEFPDAILTASQLSLSSR